MFLRNAHATAVSSTPAGSEISTITTLADILGIIMNVVLGLGIALTIVFLIIGGIQYITSRGDAKAADTARSSLTNAVIGFIVVIGAFTIRIVVANVFGGDVTEVTGVTPV